MDAKAEAFRRAAQSLEGLITARDAGKQLKGDWRVDFRKRKLNALR